MTRSLSYECAYDISPHEAFRIRNRLEYLQEKSRFLGQHNFAVLELRQRDDRFRCVTRMQVDTDLPVWARRHFRPRNMITQYELWHPPWPDGTRIFDIVATVDAVPVAIRGRGTVTSARNGGCDCQIHIEISSSMAIFGSRLEDLVADQLNRTIAGDRKFALSWLASSGLIGR